MKYLSNMKLGAKISFLTVIVAAVIFIGLTFYIVSYVRGSELESAYKYSEALAKDNASVAAAELESALDTARILAQVMSGYENIAPQDRREYYNSILKQVVESDEKMLGAWTRWKPYALDDLDNEYKNTEGHDKTGAFAPHWIRSSSGIKVRPLQLYDSTNISSYNQFMVINELALDPYELEIDGQKKLVTSLVVPIKDANGRVMGVTGVDMALDTLQSLQFSFGEYTDYYYFLMSNNGQYVIHQEDYVGRNFKEIGSSGDEASEVFEAINAGEVHSFRSQSTIIFSKCWYTFVPVKIGNINAPWAFGFVVEMDELTAQSNGTIILLIAIFLLVLIAMAVSIVFVVSKVVTKPISNLVQQANKLAMGKTDLEIDTRSKDELGDLMRSFQSLVKNIKQQAKYAEQIARGNLKIAIKPRSDQDVLSKSMQYVVQTLNKLVAEAETLTKAAVKGDLTTRGNEAIFRGGYQDIVAGFNNTLDAMGTPINEATAVLSRIEQGNLGARMIGNYQGDFAKIKTAVNTTGQELQSYIAEISDALSKMAESNLDVHITREYLGDFNQMKLSINNISDSFNVVASELQNTSEQVESGAIDVANTSQVLTQGSAEQASAVEEISAVITQVSSQTKQNALNANEANDIAVKAKSMAEQGNQQMKDMLMAMNGISQSSNNISKIIRVIDGIAFQTKILSLNAAVEAARVGEHGKGFAVVAEEVRSLAARSTNAAQETTDLIDDTLKRVNEGTAIANATAEALDKIVTQITAAGEIVEEIAEASNEQASAIEEISQGIMQVSQVTQANTATAEQSAAASEEMSSQAQLLNDLVGQFTLKSNEIDRDQLSAIQEEQTALSEVAVVDDLNSGNEAEQQSDNEDVETDSLTTEENSTTESDPTATEFGDELDELAEEIDNINETDRQAATEQNDLVLDEEDIEIIDEVDQEDEPEQDQTLDYLENDNAQAFLQNLTGNSFTQKEVETDSSTGNDTKKRLQDLGKKLKNKLNLWNKEK